MNPSKKAQVKTLPNGLQICVVPFSGVKTINLRAIVFTGSAYENTSNNGISHFLEHMMFRGNRKLGTSNQVSLLMEEMGGDLNAATSFDLTEYWLDYHVDYCQTGLERFCDFLQEPVFDNIELERSIILEELKADYNEKEQLIDLDGICCMEIWPDHGLGLPVSGTRSSIKGITQQELEKWYARYYQPGNMIIGIAGDFDPEATIRFFEERFSAASSTRYQKYPAVTASDIREPLKLVDHKDNQFNLQWSFPRYPMTGDLRIRYQLIRRILDDGSSSRLQRLIREEKGLVYDVSADMLYFKSGAMLSINSLIGLDRLPELVSVVTGLIRNLIDEGATMEELELAKRRYQIALDCNQDSPQGILFETIAPLTYPGIYPYEITREKLSAVTLEDINTTLRDLLQQGRTCFTIVGPAPEKHREMLTDALGFWLKR